jgi:hypothetical protein
MSQAPPIVVPTEQDETAHAQALALRYRSEFIDLRNFRIRHEVLRSVPVDMMFRYNFVPLEQEEGPAGDRGERSEQADDARRNQRPAGAADGDAGGDAVADHRSAEEDGAEPARAGRGERGADVRRALGEDNSDENISIEKLTRRGHQPDYPAGGYDDLYRAGAARFGHSHRDVRRFGAGEVPH